MEPSPGIEDALPGQELDPEAADEATPAAKRPRLAARAPSKDGPGLAERPLEQQEQRKHEPTQSLQKASSDAAVATAAATATPPADVAGTEDAQSPAYELPIVNLQAFVDLGDSWDPEEPLPEGAVAVAKEWRRAFATFGFAHIVGHGVPDDVIEGAFSMARRFFALPPEEKDACNLGKGYGFGGYNGQGVERVSSTASKPDGAAMVGAAKARPPDRVESMIVHRSPDDVIPASLDGYAHAVHRYHDELARVLRVLMRVTACSVDLPIDYFDQHFFGEGGVGAESCVGECSLRLAYYPASNGDVPARQLRYGEHTDYTGFTILWQDHNENGPQTPSHQAASGQELGDARPPRGGLQVRMPDHTWLDCPPVPGAFTVNSGDMVQVWTNDVLLSNMHRVTNPPPGDAGDRLSLVFFTGPSADTVVECLPTCWGPNRPKRYAPVTAGQHLARKLAASNK